jgi:uncharacterized protein (TIRG00374 family)
MFVSLYLRTARWQYMLRPLSSRIPLRQTIAVGLIGSGATFFAPLRLGEVVRPYLISANQSPVSFSQALGTVAAERSIDGLVMVLMTAVALALSTPVSPLPDHVGRLPIPVSLVPSALLTAAVVFAVALAGMFVLYAMRERAKLVLRASIGRFSTDLADRLAGSLDRLGQGLAFLTDLRTSLPFMRDTVLFWATSALANLVLLSGVGLEPSFAQACVSLGLIGLGLVLPAGPGFFGAYQVATYTALAMYYRMADVTTRGAMFVFTSYLGHVLINALSCIVGFMLLARSTNTPRSAAA